MAFEGVVLQEQVWLQALPHLGFPPHHVCAFASATPSATSWLAVGALRTIQLGVT